MNQQQPTSPHQSTSQIVPIDPTPIMQSESPTAVILAIAILMQLLNNRCYRNVKRGCQESVR